VSESRKKKAAPVEEEVVYHLPVSWAELLGHERPKKWFDIALRQNRLASTFLFVGKEGIGKRTFAKLLAKSLFCKNASQTALDFCGRCEACVQVDASTHPDLIEIGKPADRATIPVDLLIGPPEARMREGLCHDIRLKAFYGGRIVY
jgi:DNA polymerase-3 subunit delta'